MSSFYISLWVLPEWGIQVPACYGICKVWEKSRASMQYVTATKCKHLCDQIG